MSVWITAAGHALARSVRLGPVKRLDLLKDRSKHLLAEVHSILFRTLAKLILNKKRPCSR